MGMPASVAGDQSMGHVFSPSPIVPSQITVLAMGNGKPSAGKAVHVVGDTISVHVLGNSAHAGTIAVGSTTVYANSKGIVRIMDTGDCGAMIMGTAGTVLVGG